MIINIFCILLILLTIGYVFIISIITYGWFKLKTYHSKSIKTKTKISIIVPARNEESNIQNCLNDLVNQNYPVELYEIIIIDDDSEDNTYKLVKTFIDSKKKDGPEIILIRNSNDQLIAGKKTAIREGIRISSGELIITTDADCRFSSEWIRIIADYFNENDIKLLTGPVVFFKSNSIFKSMQTLEFLSLIASAAGFIGAGNPILGNASNLAFHKKTYFEAEKIRTDYDLASGDDVFLLHYIKKIYGASKIGFLKNHNSVVTTLAMNTLKELFSQRMRWVSKARKYKDPLLIITSWITFVVNFSLFVGFMLSIAFNQLFHLMLLLLLIKILADLPVLAGVCYFARRSKLLLLLIPLEIINIVYVTIIAFAGIFFKTRWKGKEIQ